MISILYFNRKYRFWPININGTWVTQESNQEIENQNTYFNVNNFPVFPKINESLSPNPILTFYCQAPITVQKYGKCLTHDLFLHKICSFSLAKRMTPWHYSADRQQLLFIHIIVEDRVRPIVLMLNFLEANRPGKQKKAVIPRPSSTISRSH